MNGYMDAEDTEGGPGTSFVCKHSTAAAFRFEICSPSSPRIDASCPSPAIHQATDDVHHTASQDQRLVVSQRTSDPESRFGQSNQLSRPDRCGLEDLLRPPKTQSIAYLP
jgi:hypothetical protein